MDTTHGPTGRRVLVVDDNRDSADTLAMIVRSWGHDVRTGYSGQQGLREALQFLPETCLLDLGMPGMSGLELASRLRQEPTTAGAVLVAVSGWGDPESRQKAKKAGFDHHFLKPADLNALHEVLAGTPRV
jgi:CheY-like chemotaxis protein